MPDGEIPAEEGVAGQEGGEGERRRPRKGDGEEPSPRRSRCQGRARGGPSLGAAARARRGGVDPGPYNPRLPSSVASPLLILALLLGAFLSLASAPRPRPRGLPQEKAGRLDCASCHAEIHAEWEGSLHGRARKDPIYQAAVKKVTNPASCYPCHVPKPLHESGLGNLPVAREDDRDSGIHCDACHLGADGAYHGPFGGKASAHGSTADPLFSDLLRTNSLCVTCHSTRIGPVLPLGKDFEESGGTAKGRSCVGCHMEPVERAAATDAGLAEPPPKRPGRSHALHSPRDGAFARKAFALEVLRSGRQVRVLLKNEAGHRVPGLTTREFRVKVSLLSSSGSEVASREEVIDHRAFLRVDHDREIPLEAPAGAVRVRVRIVCRQPEGGETPVLEEIRDL